MYPWVLPATHCRPACLSSWHSWQASFTLPTVHYSKPILHCLCCAYQLALCEQDYCVCVCVWCTAKWCRQGLVCYQIMQAHLGLHQHHGRHRPAPVKPEPRADAGEPSAQNGSGVRNTHLLYMHTHKHRDSWIWLWLWWLKSEIQNKTKFDLQKDAFNFQDMSNNIQTVCVGSTHIGPHRLCSLPYALIHKHCFVGMISVLFPSPKILTTKSPHFFCCYGYMAWLQYVWLSLHAFKCFANLHTEWISRTHLISKSKKKKTL